VGVQRDLRRCITSSVIRSGSGSGVVVGPGMVSVGEGVGVRVREGDYDEYPYSRRVEMGEPSLNGARPAKRSRRRDPRLGRESGGRKTGW
jgi:hypothetical protein